MNDRPPTSDELHSRHMDRIRRLHEHLDEAERYIRMTQHQIDLLRQALGLPPTESQDA